MNFLLLAIFPIMLLACPEKNTEDKPSNRDINEEAHSTPSSSKEDVNTPPEYQQLPTNNN